MRSARPGLVGRGPASRRTPLLRHPRTLLLTLFSLVLWSRDSFAQRYGVAPSVSVRRTPLRGSTAERHESPPPYLRRPRVTYSFEGYARPWAQNRQPGEG